MYTAISVLRVVHVVDLQCQRQVDRRIQYLDLEVGQVHVQAVHLGVQVVLDPAHLLYPDVMDHPAF